MSEQTNSADTSAHTATPWNNEVLIGTGQSIHGSRCVSFITAGGTNVADVCDSSNITEAEARANAEFIVRACNRDHAFDDLVAAAKLARKQLMLWMKDHGRDIASDEAIAEINAALAKATK